MMASAGRTDRKTQLLYLDISDPAGAIVPRGSLEVDGLMNGYGAHDGRKLDFADGKTAHVIGEHAGDGGGYTLSTADFSNPDAPVLVSALAIAQTGWTAAARFAGDRLYLAPQFGDGVNTSPVQVYDLADPAAPWLAGTIALQGQVWNILPAPGSQVFALADDLANVDCDPLLLQHLDVIDPAAPRLLEKTFGASWAVTADGGAYKAFTLDATKRLGVLAFPGLGSQGRGSNNGLQLIEFSPMTETTPGPAEPRGWTARGIQIGNRLVSLSRSSLTVVDYANPMAPAVVNKLALESYMALPNGDRVLTETDEWLPILP